MIISLGYIGKIEAEKTIRDILSKSNYNLDSTREISYGLQFDIHYSENKIGCLRIFENKKGETKLDLSQIFSEEHKKSIADLVSKSLSLSLKNGRMQLPQRFFFNIDDVEILKNIKNILIKDFDGKPQETKDDKIYFLVRLDGITVLCFKNGSILIQGKHPTELSDNIVNKINKIYEQNSKKAILKILKINLPLLKETEYDKISEELEKYNVNVERYIPVELYSYLNVNDRVEVRDGLLLLEFVKTKNLPLKNFTSLVRNFAIAYEGFLIKLLFDLKVLDLSNLSLETVKIGYYIKGDKDGTSELEKRYSFLFKKKPYLAKKIWSYWQECRNDYLHSDFIKFPMINKIEIAESKIRELIDVMGGCLEIFESEIKPNIEDLEFNNRSIIGIDEAGKGDYFGPLVVAAVYCDENTMKNLSLSGIRDSKLIPDSKIKILYDKINPKCKVEFVKINPEKYNELYNEIGNLNQLLAWGHARALENILTKVKCEYALSDQFGDETLIISRLMQLGKRVNLIQKPKAESNIAVAAASIVARHIFLEELKKISRIYKINLPKGASDSVEETAREFVRKYGEKELSRVAKLHFKTTKNVLGGFKNEGSTKIQTN